MSNLTTYDIPFLRSYGFEAGFSGTTWFGKDKNGVEYQAVESEDNEHLVFYLTDTRLPCDLNREDIERDFKEL